MQESSIDGLPASVGEEANMLFTILSAIDAFADFTDILAGKTTNVELMKEGRTLFFLLFEYARVSLGEKPLKGCGEYAIQSKDLQTAICESESHCIVRHRRTRQKDYVREGSRHSA